MTSLRCRSVGWMEEEEEDASPIGKRRSTEEVEIAFLFFVKEKEGIWMDSHTSGATFKKISGKKNR